MKEKLGCAVLIAMGLALWIGLIHGCEKFESWKLKRHLQQQDEKARNGESKPSRTYRPSRRERHRCSSCGEYSEAYYCEMCGKYYCNDCYINDIAITHDGRVPND